VTAGPIVLAAGGTGGHIFPAEALARELKERGHDVALITDRRGQAFGDRVPDVATYRIHAGRFGGNVVAKALGAAELMLGVVESGRKLRQLGAPAVVGFGGYPSVPPLYAATRLGLPTLIHEQNAILGRANRLLAPRVRSIAVSFHDTFMVRADDRAKLVFTGNPVRPAIAALRDVAYDPPSLDAPLHLLVLGGSQGARIFSEMLPAALALVAETLRRRLRISQQARPEDIEAVRRAYAELRIEAELATFFDDVPARLASAQLVIARAGASTLTELTCSGRPAILVPYPHAADDHQTANAQALAALGGAFLVPQPEFTPETLARLLRELAQEPQRLIGAAQAAHDYGTPNAARVLADLVVGAIGESNGSSSSLTRKTAA
jgi:UDP-N-acetylglucosamine--N-acetylmuramyl-(pentapeptide) pyrophosphoryl-undecaprenol N-acetylglucosamine transferase